MCYTCCFSESQWNKTVLLFLHLEIKGCVCIKQAHSSADPACGWLATRLVVKNTTLFQGWMTAISAQLVVRHLFFPVDISIWWMDWEWPWIFTALVLNVLYVLQCKLPPPPFTQTGLTAELWDNLNVLFFFVVFHSFTHTGLIYIVR